MEHPKTKKFSKKEKGSGDLLTAIKELIIELDFEVSTALQKWRTNIGNGFWKSISFAGYPYIWAGVAILFAFFDMFQFRWNSQG